MRKNYAFRKIDKKIYIVFFVVIAIALINAIISTYSIQRSQRVTGEVISYTHPSIDALTRFNLLVTRSRMLTTNWVYIPNSDVEKDSLRYLNNVEYIELRGRLSALMRDEKGDFKRVLNNLFSQYDSLSRAEEKIMILLSSFASYQDPARKFAAENILESEIIPKSEQITAQINVLLKQQTDTSISMQDTMLYQFNLLLVFVPGLALLIVISVLVAGLIISRTIIVPILEIRSILLQMGKGELPEIRYKRSNNAVGEMYLALSMLIDGFRHISKFAEEIGKGNFNSEFKPLSSNDVQGHALLRMRSQLKIAYDKDNSRRWIAESLANLNNIIRESGEDFNEFLDKIVHTIVEKLEVQQAAVFLLHNEDMNDLHIQLGSYYALNHRILNSKRYELKEGLIGQAIATNTIIDLDNITDPFFTIDTGFVEIKQCSLMIIPLLTSGKVVGAIQIASVNALSNDKKELLIKMAEPIASSLFSVRANLITSQLLFESRKQADELAYQEQELRKINDELTKQSQLLRQSEEELMAQQEELKEMNNQLHEKARLLEEQNLAVEDARRSLSFKAEQLEQSNKYKSAFLANMSHELRTPLNSILILAKLLAENKNNNLDSRQTEHANIIYKSGNDLLALINDILDLSKIEAGKVDLQFEKFEANSLGEDMKNLFSELANEKQIRFSVVSELKDDFCISADKIRIEQILKNLLSNAFKFTPAGSAVKFELAFANRDILFSSKTLLQSEEVISLKVIDQGIGISPDKHSLIFEAFQQADSSTNRKFGGTGLGLAISRELAQIMGGEIQLQSEVGKGSTFTLYIPVNAELINKNGIADRKQELKSEAIESNSHDELEKEFSSDEIVDDKNNLNANDRAVLIVEDDYIFARMLMNHCHKFGFKAIVALRGDQGLHYAGKFKPYAIILDMRLPVMDGWSVLKKLKENENLRRIPVHIISSIDKRNLGIDLGAYSYMTKPAGKDDMDNLFSIIESHTKESKHNIIYIGNRKEEIEKVLSLYRKKESPIMVESAITVEQCIEMARRQHYGCIVVDELHVTTQQENIWSDLKSEGPLQDIPLVFCPQNPDECLREVADLFGNNTKDGRMDALDETSLFLDAVKNNQNDFDTIQHRMSELLKGKTILLVDDDMRNIYSMTNSLENEGINVICAYNGKEAIEKLESNKHIELVLMDIMMPVMNGYEAIAEIRKRNEWKMLPVIAVTAKAMNNDREKCMEAGASDYLTKPVNMDQLISLMRVWLYK